MRRSTLGIATCIILFQTFLVWGQGMTAIAFNNQQRNKAVQDSLKWADYYYNIHRYHRAISLYQKSLTHPEVQKTPILKRLALSEAALNNAEQSTAYIYDYLKLNFQPSFLLHEGFDPIREAPTFVQVTEKTLPKIRVWGGIYFVVALIGFYVVATLLLNKKVHMGSRLLIAAFVFIHSLFMLNISINKFSYLFEFPHSYLISTWSSFLYGPLLYFYFKRVSYRYAFRWADIWHLLPTIALLAYLIPEVYLMSGSEKLQLMLSRLQEGVSPEDSSKLILLVVLKALSLAGYALFIHRLLRQVKTSQSLVSRTVQWQHNMYYIHVAYVVAYSVYGISISTGNPYPILYHTPILLMGFMVLYVGYAANVQPDVFNGLYTYTNQLFPKYLKSGLTESLSLELKHNLIDLFEKENLYRKNDINLDMVAERLHTTRHNASQIINEHFDMSFHEFINQFRIKEAKALLADTDKRNIIDIAYEVGYNNKVTFNKAFKKQTDRTPSQYVLEVRQQIHK